MSVIAKSYEGPNAPPSIVKAPLHRSSRIAPAYRAIAGEVLAGPAAPRYRLIMKQFLSTVILMAAVSLACADDRSITEKTLDATGAVVHKSKEIALDAKDRILDAAHHAERAARAAWSKSKAYVSDEVPVYREGAKTTLANLADEIADA